MNINVTVHVHLHDGEIANEIRQGLGRIEQTVNALLEAGAASAAREIRTMKELDDIEREVAENASVTESAVALLGSLSDLIRANAADPVKLEELATKLDAQSNALAAAVAANTPAAV